jgi:hypothetical protein
MNYEEYKVGIPVGKCGKWSIEHFTITQDQADHFNLRERFNNHGMGYRGIVAGTYTRLKRDNAYDPMMSDTPAEINDHLPAIEKATGQVLINGLGIGMVLNACLKKPEVDHVTVIEIDPDIIQLVAPHYQQIWGDRLSIIQDDAFKFIPPKDLKYNMIWMDIWPDICADNLEEMKVLKKKYRKHLVRGGWQGCWSEKEVKRLDRYGY